MELGGRGCSIVLIMNLKKEHYDPIGNNPESESLYGLISRVGGSCWRLGI